MTLCDTPGSKKRVLSRRCQRATPLRWQPAFAQDTVLNAQQVVRNVLVAYAPNDARIELEPILPSGLLWFEQVGNNLGERLDSVVKHISNLGFSPFIILGADNPTLPTAFIENSLRVLTSDQADILWVRQMTVATTWLGFSIRLGLFQNFGWSTPSAYELTAANAYAPNLRLNKLPRWYDVDTPADLERLREEILSDIETQQRCRILVAGSLITLHHHRKYQLGSG